MKRIIGVAALLAVLGLIAALVWLSRSIDGMVEDAIQSAGSELLDTRVSVGSVSIDLREGRGTVRDLRVHNPEGFSDADAFSFGELVVGIDLGSVRSSPIVLTEVGVTGPVVLAEANARGANLEVLRRNVQKSSASEADAEVAEEGAEPTRLRIQHLEIAKARAMSDTTALGGKAEEIDVPGLELTDVSGTPGEIGKRVLDAWLARIARAAAVHQAKRAIGKAIGDESEKVGEKLKELFE